MAGAYRQVKVTSSASRCSTVVCLNHDEGPWDAFSRRHAFHGGEDVMSFGVHGDCVYQCRYCLRTSLHMFCDDGSLTNTFSAMGQI